MELGAFRLQYPRDQPYIGCVTSSWMNLVIAYMQHENDLNPRKCGETLSLFQTASWNANKISVISLIESERNLGIFRLDGIGLN